jgi:2-keto-3-deoxy-L-rhamnonate aldolase RhmA
LIFFGPGDYSLRAGFPGNFEDPRYWKAVREIATAAQSAGKGWGTPAISPDHARQLLDAGAMLITRAGDMTLLRTAYTDLKTSFSTLGFTFDTD